LVIVYESNAVVFPSSQRSRDSFCSKWIRCFYWNAVFI